MAISRDKIQLTYPMTLFVTVEPEAPGFLQGLPVKNPDYIIRMELGVGGQAVGAESHVLRQQFQQDLEGAVRYCVMELAARLADQRVTPNIADDYTEAVQRHLMS